MAHELEPERENTFLELGRLVHQESYSRDKKEFSAPGVKFDLIRKDNGRFVVGEIKKSSRSKESAEMQLAYYIWRLKQMGASAEGELLIPKERKRFPIKLTPKIQEKVEKTIEDIQKIISQEKPPPAIRNHFCKNCAYKEFCWS